MNRYATEELWLPVPGAETRYEVSNFGRVKSLGRPAIGKRKSARGIPPRILKPGPSSTGYLSVLLTRAGGSHNVHVLVLKTHFIGPRRPGDEARHRDGTRTNNRLDNLVWGSRSDNIRDAVAHGSWESEKRKAGRLVTSEKVRGQVRPQIRGDNHWTRRRMVP